MTKPKKILVTFPVKWAQMGGIPRGLDRTPWKPGMELMILEHRQEPYMAAMSQKIADTAITRMLLSGG